MAPDELKRIGATLYEHGWQTKLAELIKIDARTMRAYIAGKYRIPRPTVILIRLIAAHKQIFVALDDDRTAISKTERKT